LSQVDFGVCEVCGDRGFITLPVSVNDPRHGQATLCPRHCAAAQQLKRDRDQRLYAAAKLPNEHQGCTLATFLEATQHNAALWAGKQLAYYATEAFIKSLVMPHDAGQFEVDFADIAYAAGGSGAPDIRRSLIFTGPFGVGKTGFAAAIVNAAVDAGVSVRYARTMSFLNAVQNRYGMQDNDPFPDDEFGALDAGAVVNAVQKVPLLVLDDFDIPNLKENSDKAAKMQDVIRYRHGYHLPTIITTNLETLSAIEERWGATTSTVLGQMAHLIPVTGAPMRPIPQVTRW
jgi:DNA replication protein DnaC